MGLRRPRRQTSFCLGDSQAPSVVEKIPVLLAEPALLAQLDSAWAGTGALPASPRLRSVTLDKSLCLSGSLAHGAKTPRPLSPAPGATRAVLEGRFLDQSRDLSPGREEGVSKRQTPSSLLPTQPQPAGAKLVSKPTRNGGRGAVSSGRTLDSRRDGETGDRGSSLDVPPRPAASPPLLKKYRE